METLKSKLNREKLLRISAIQIEKAGGDSFAALPYMDYARFDTEQLLHVFGKTFIALYAESDYTETLSYIEKSNRNIILYANAHVFNEKSAVEHPDWIQRTADGSDARGYDVSFMACMNSPWRESFFDSIRASLKLPVEGFFLDGPIFIGEGCHCASCQRLFEESFGHPLCEATSDEMRKFKSDSVSRFIADVRKIVGDKILYANSSALSPNITGCTINSVLPYVDILGTEGGFIFYGDPNRVSLLKISTAAKYMESRSCGKPRVIFCAGNHQPWARTIHTPDEITMMYAATCAHGASMWFGLHGPVSNYDTPGGRAGLEFNRFLADNEDFYTATKQLAKTALFRSWKTADKYADAVEETDFTRKQTISAEHSFGSYQREFDGICEILARAHKQFAIVDEECDLSQYETLVLPNAMYLDASAEKKIREFVGRGGRLIATGYIPALFDLFGMTGTPERLNYKPGCGIFETSLGMNRDFPAGLVGGVLRAEYDGVEVLASQHLPLRGRYAEFQPEKFPAIVRRGNVTYIAGNAGQTFADYGVADIQDIVAELVPETLIELENAYESVEVVMRKQSERTIVHFINYTGAMRRPLRNIIPCPGIKVKMPLEKKASRVYSIYDKREIPFEQKNGCLSFTVDVGAYEAVVID